MLFPRSQMSVFARVFLVAVLAIAQACAADSAPSTNLDSRPEDTSDQTDAHGDAGSESDTPGMCAEPIAYFLDADGDGFGDDQTRVEACEPPGRDWVTVGGDCDDQNPDINPDADEVCDGIDNNCDGLVDSGPVVAELCPLQKGVCAGAVISVCAGDIYAECGAQEYGPDYTDDPHEDRRCDGLDNNCDGQVDSSCCGAAGNQSDPQAHVIGQALDVMQNSDGMSQYQATPTVIEPAAQAPDGAAALVVYLESSTSLHAQYLDEDGVSVGEAYSANVRNAVSATVVATPFGYDLIWGEVKEAGGSDFSTEVFVQPISPKLEISGAKEKLYSQTGPVWKLKSLSAAYHDRSVVVGLTIVTLGPSFEAVHYAVDDRKNSPQLLDLGGGGLFGSAHLRVNALDSGILVTWYRNAGVGSGGSKTTGKLYGADGRSKGSFEYENTDQRAEQFDVLQVSEEEILLVHPSMRGTNKVLTAARVNLKNAQEIEPVELTTSVANHIAPSLIPRGQNADGYPEEVTITWLLEGTRPAMLVASSFELENLSLIPDESRIAANMGNVENTALVNVGRNAVVVWQTRGEGAQTVQSAPISFQGPGLCFQ